MALMEDGDWAKVGKVLAGLVLAGAVGDGIYFGGRAVYDSAKSAGAKEAEVALTDKLTKEGRLLPENACLSYVLGPSSTSEYYQGTGECEGLEIVVKLASSDGGKPTFVILKGFGTKLTLGPDAPYVTDIQHQEDAWTRYTAPIPTSP